MRVGGVSDGCMGGEGVGWCARGGGRARRQAAESAHVVIQRGRGWHPCRHLSPVVAQPHRVGLPVLRAARWLGGWIVGWADALPCDEDERSPAHDYRILRFHPPTHPPTPPHLRLAVVHHGKDGSSRGRQARRLDEPPPAKALTGILDDVRGREGG